MANQFTTGAFPALYAAQGWTKGVAIVATVGALAVAKPAILSGVPTDPAFMEGTTAEAGTYELQMLASDFSSEPPRLTAVTCNGEATGKALVVLNVTNANGTYVLTVGDVAA